MSAPPRTQSAPYWYLATPSSALQHDSPHPYHYPGLSVPSGTQTTLCDNESYPSHFPFESPWDAVARFADFNPGVALYEQFSNNHYNPNPLTDPFLFNQYSSTTANLQKPLTMPTTVALSEIVSPPVPHQDAQTVPKGHKFRCEMCLKTFDRRGRLENCRNRHTGEKPYHCLGKCSSSRCSASYASRELLQRHISPSVACASCGKNLAKQNMPRHKATCRVRHQ